MKCFYIIFRIIIYKNTIEENNFYKIKQTSQLLYLENVSSTSDKWFWEKRTIDNYHGEISLIDNIEVISICDASFNCIYNKNIDSLEYWFVYEYGEYNLFGHLTSGICSNGDTLKKNMMNTED